jgi:hypothetical protein
LDRRGHHSLLFFRVGAGISVRVGRFWVPRASASFFPFSTFRQSVMVTVRDVGPVSILGVVVGSPGGVEIEYPGGNPLGLKAVNPEVLVNKLTSGIELGTHTSISLSFTSGLDYDMSMASLLGFIPGMDPLLGLPQGDFSCIGSKPGDIFADDCWGTQQKSFPETISCARFSPLEIITDIGAFPEPPVNVSDLFGGDYSP